jgi:hypothetical protein
MVRTGAIISLSRGVPITTAGYSLVEKRAGCAAHEDIKPSTLFESRGPAVEYGRPLACSY